MHIEPWGGAPLPRRTAWLLEGVGGPPGRWDPGIPELVEFILDLGWALCPLWWP